jgi:Flp pilus assembly protein TadD
VAWVVGAGASGRLRAPLFAATCAAVTALLVSLAMLTWMQVQVWRTTESLWTHATDATPECSICHDNYGALIVNRLPARLGDTLIAIEHFKQALLLRPDRDKPYGGLGLALIQLGRPPEAESALRRAIVATPKDVAAFNNLGFALNQQARFAEAVPYLRRAVALDDHNVVARTNLGQALVGLARFDEGIGELRRAAAEQPYAPEPRIGLVLGYRAAGNTTEMRKQLMILRQLHSAAAQDLTAKHRL